MDTLLSQRWKSRIERSASGAPTVSPLFVVEQGSSVQLVDLRAPEEATGILGHVAGSAFLEPAEVPRDAAVVLVDADGETAQAVALELERGGMQHVAAMAGGLAAWRRLGFGVSREPARPLEPREHPEPRDATSPLTIEDLREHLGDSRSVRWAKLSLLLSLQHASCIDGRDDRSVIGTPGGDAGEFLLLMAALEKVTGETLDEPMVDRALLAHIDAFGDFYMHTDANAVTGLIDAARRDVRLRGALANIDQPKQFFELLKQPPEELRGPLLELIVDPAHIGCGHIRLMLQKSDEYEVRPELLKSFLRAFYRLWWQAAPELIMTMLPGDHGEAAVVNVCTSENLWSLAPVPLISPSEGGIQLFVNHPDVANYLRKLVVEFLVRGNGPIAIGPEQAEELEEAVRALAAKQLGATARELAAGLPVFDVTFARGGAIEVSAS